MNYNNNQLFDVVIIGGGVTGTALLYLLSKYTNVKNIALIEKYRRVGQVNSNAKNNSQTLHFGDIETNYTPEKAKKVKEGATMVKNYLEKIEGSIERDHVFRKYTKMALAVGEEEVKFLKKRYKKIKDIYPELKFIKRKEIAELEPKVIQGRDKKEKIGAIYSREGYTVNYGRLSESFINEARSYNKNIKLFLSTKAIDIKKRSKKQTVFTSKGSHLNTKFIVISSGAYSLCFAQSLGYGKDLSILSVAGNFYHASNLLNGKVYTCQLPKLPFAAIHGDPEVQDSKTTRFGPTAKVILSLERYRHNTFGEYMYYFGLRPSTVITGFKLLSDPDIFKYILKNLAFDLPYYGKKLFLKEIKKIVPTLKLKDLHPAKHIGGSRPQVINTKEKTLSFGEAKISERRIIFNITPSPGATMCLKNAYDDAKTIINDLGEGHYFDEEKFKKDLL